MLHGGNKVEIRELGYCGLNCEACPVFIARVDNDDELREKTALEWSRLYADYLGKVALKKEDMNCGGCCAGESIFIGCMNCQIRACCRTKGFNTCASCGEYPTCEMLNGFYTVPSHKIAKANLDRIRINQ